MPARLRSALFSFASTLDGIAVGQGATTVTLTLGATSIELTGKQYELLNTSYQTADAFTRVSTTSRVVDGLPPSVR